MALGDIVQKFSSFGGVFKKRKSESVLGVDVSSSTIKVVQISKKHGRVVLETYGELALGPYAGVGIGKATKLPTDKMAEALRDLMREARVTTDQCGVAIPLSASLINVIEMPDVGEKKLREMVPIEMRKYIPVSISEVMLDWQVIPKEREEEEIETPEGSKKHKKNDVLVVVIHNDTIKTYQEIVKKAELVASFFEIEVFSTLRSVLDGSVSPAMVVDIGAGTTKIYIAEHRVLRESHIINRGAQDITLALSRSMGVSSEKAIQLKHDFGLDEDAPDKNVAEVISLVLDNIFAEAHRVLLQYQKRRHKNIAQVVISGGGASTKGIEKPAQRALEAEITTADPFAKLLAPAFLEDILKEAGPEFAVAIGVALRKLEENG